MKKFNVKSVYIANTAVISLFAAGLLSGLVVDFGNRLQIIPVSDGYPNYSAAYKLKRGVCDITDYFGRLLTAKSYYFGNTHSELEKLRNIKEKCCYVALDIQEERKKSPSEVQITHVMPNGKEVIFDTERFETPEVFFDLDKLGIDQKGIQHQIMEVVSKCAIDNRKELYRNILLTGGSTSYPGFAKRLKEEVWKLISNTRNPSRLKYGDIRVLTSSSCKYLAWTGGSLFASINAFKEQSIWRAHYDNYPVDDLIPSHYDS